MWFFWLLFFSTDIPLLFKSVKVCLVKDSIDKLERLYFSALKMRIYVCACAACTSWGVRGLCVDQVLLAKHVVRTHGAERSNQALKWSCCYSIISPTVRSFIGWVGADQSYWWLPICITLKKVQSNVWSLSTLSWQTHVSSPSVALHCERSLFAFLCGPV